MSEWARTGETILAQNYALLWNLEDGCLVRNHSKYTLAVRIHDKMIMIVDTNHNQLVMVEEPKLKPKPPNFPTLMMAAEKHTNTLIEDVKDQIYQPYEHYYDLLARSKYLVRIFHNNLNKNRANRVPKAKFCAKCEEYKTKIIKWMDKANEAIMEQHKLADKVLKLEEMLEQEGIDIP